MSYDDWKLASPEDEEFNGCPNCGERVTDKDRYHGYCSTYCRDE